jgi:hypothetical protein
MKYLKSLLSGSNLLAVVKSCELGDKFGMPASLVFRKLIDEGLKHCREELRFSRRDGRRKGKTAKQAGGSDETGEQE